ncbi:hypothetical protein BD779DRAFT_116767 [Infundibulicybe gibba]|nr:hypothetical protein BD779DRAFT_116767 [Infundibulicybe gibba]
MMETPSNISLLQAKESPSTSKLMDTLSTTVGLRHEKDGVDHSYPNKPDVEPTSNPRPPSGPSPFQLPVELLTHIFTLACKDNGITGRSLSLVSKAFREAVEPVVLRTLNLHSAGHVSWLERLLATNPSAKNAIRHLHILLPGKEGDLMKQEVDWELIPVEGPESLFWDTIYWDFLDGDYADAFSDGGFVTSGSESSEDEDEDEQTDLLEDLAFFASEEGQGQSSLVYNGAGNVVDGRVPPHLVDTERSIADSITAIVQELAPVLQKLKLMSSTLPRVRLPHCPALFSLEIDTPFLIHFDKYCAAFPVLKQLCLRGPYKQEYLDIDNIIFNAPALTYLRAPFSEDFLHALASALGLFPDSVDPICRTEYRFAHMERIILIYYDMDPTEALSRLSGMVSNTWEKTIIPLRRRMGTGEKI